MNPGGTSFQRCKYLKEAGYNVYTFDTFSYLKPSLSKFTNFLTHRLYYGDQLDLLNDSLLAFIINKRKIDIIWVDKGCWIYKDVLLRLKSSLGAVCIHYSLDAHFYWNKSRHFIQSIPYYDYIFTTKPFEVDLYVKNGATKVAYIFQGFDSRFINFKYNKDFYCKHQSDISFVGHYQKHYYRTIESIAKAGFEINVWGPNWQLYTSNYKNLKMNSAIWGSKYMNALYASKICLGLLGKHIPETSTTRSFEIPALGKFLLAERTDEHLNFFDEGKEAEFFATKDELLDKINFYLNNDIAREKIAQAGRLRSIKSDYSSKSQIIKIMVKVVR